MAVPIAVWIAAGLGAAGIKLYMDMRNVGQIVENSEARYEEEKYNFYQTQQLLLPLLLRTGNLKLEIWQNLARYAVCIDNIEHLPRQVKYKKFEGFRVGKPERVALKETAAVSEAIINSGLAQAGSGVLTGLALYSGTMTQKLGENDITSFPGFPPCEQGSSILEALSTHKVDTLPGGNSPELAVLNAILAVPSVIQDFGVAKLPKNDKEAAARLKDKIDKHSMELADVVGKMQRITVMMTRVSLYTERTYNEYLTSVKKLEKLVQTKSDYNAFTDAEKELLVYTGFLVRALKKLTRIDILLKRGNMYVFNTIDIRDALDLAGKLFPDEELPKS